jgi:hypothetical protein
MRPQNDTIRSLPANPSRLIVHRATSLNFIDRPTHSMSATFAPEAYAAATMAPALTPAMQ